MSDSYLRLQNVVKSYDGRVNAVDGISIDVRRGEFLTLLGPSGSGKTTTLLMIAGFEELTAGTLELEGRSLANVREFAVKYPRELSGGQQQRGWPARWCSSRTCCCSTSPWAPSTRTCASRCR